MPTVDRVLPWRRSAAPRDAVLAPLLDDLNTPLAVAGLFSLADELRSALNGDRSAPSLEAIARGRETLLSAAELLGALRGDPEAWFKGGAEEGVREKIESLIEARAAARAAKNWAEADRIRGELNALNVEVMDGPQGATWRFREAG